MNHSARYGVIAAVIVSALMMLILPHGASFAQTSEPVGIIDAVYRDLSTKLGQQIARGGDSTYGWEQTVFGDASLGCPQPGIAYAQVVTPGYKITVNYAGTAYDYRTNIDGTVIFQCSAAGGAAVTVVAPTVAPTAPGAPTNFMNYPLAFVNVDGNVAIIPAKDFSAVPVTGDSVRQPVQAGFLYNVTHAYDQLKWNADGSKLAFVDMRNSTAYALLSGQPVVTAASGLSIPYPISWALDGSKLNYMVSTQEQKDNGLVQQVQAVAITPANISAPEFAGTLVILVGCGGGGPRDPAELEYMRETGFGSSHQTLEWTPRGFVFTTECSGSGLSLVAPTGQVLWYAKDVTRTRVSPDRTKILAITDPIGTSGAPSQGLPGLVIIDVANGAPVGVNAQPNVDQAAWSADGSTIYYSTITPAGTVAGNADSSIGKSLLDPIWPLTAQDFNVVLWKMPTAGGPSTKLFERNGRGIGTITVSPDNDGVAFSFIPSSRALVEAINRNAPQNEILAQAPIPQIFYVKADGSGISTNPQPITQGRQPSFSTAATFQPIAAQQAGNVGGSTNGAPAGNVAPPALVVGGKAIVITTRGDTLNMRKDPSTTAPVLRILKPDAIVDVVGGPQNVDGFRWWQVRADDGSTGWVVDQVTDNDGTTNTLLPQ
jgi:hypothetical protein